MVCKLNWTSIPTSWIRSKIPHESQSHWSLRYVLYRIAKGNKNAHQRNTSCHCMYWDGDNLEYSFSLLCIDALYPTNQGPVLQSCSKHKNSWSTTKLGVPEYYKLFSLNPAKATLWNWVLCVTLENRIFNFLSHFTMFTYYKVNLQFQL